MEIFEGKTSCAFSGRTLSGRTLSGHNFSERALFFGALSGLALLAASLLLADPARAATPNKDAENIRRLDIMLMVTGLRCRTTSDNFQPDYARFTRNQLPLLNKAAATLRADLARRNGSAGAERALDKMSVTMANEFGQGHPWLNCADLKQVTRNLAGVQGEETLAEAAEQLLAPRGNPRLAYGGRWSD